MDETPDTTGRTMVFAKLFETEDIGQILAFIDKDEADRPCFRLMFYSPRYTSQITITARYPDSDAGCAEARKRLAQLTLDAARTIALDWITGP